VKVAPPEIEEVPGPSAVHGGGEFVGVAGTTNSEVRGRDRHGEGGSAVRVRMEIATVSPSDRSRFLGRGS
jgi:hypothetical protein